MSRISQNLQTGLLLAFAVLLPVATDAAADDALDASMKHLESALTQAEEAFAKIDISKLSVQYREGKLIENTRTRALRYIALARDNMKQLKKSRSVHGALLLVMARLALDSQVEALITSLGNIATAPLESQYKALEWAEAMNKVASSLSTAGIMLETAVVTFAADVDARLQGCRP